MNTESHHGSSDIVSNTDALIGINVVAIIYRITEKAHATAGCLFKEILSFMVVLTHNEGEHETPCYKFPGGGSKLRPGTQTAETPEETLKREASGEVGLLPMKYQLIYQDDSPSKYADGTMHSKFFYLVSKYATVAKPDSEKDPEILNATWQPLSFFFHEKLPYHHRLAFREALIHLCKKRYRGDKTPDRFRRALLAEYLSVHDQKVELEKKLAQAIGRADRSSEEALRRSVVALEQPLSSIKSIMFDVGLKPI